MARLLSDSGLHEGMCLVVAVDRDERGLHTLTARDKCDSWVTGIQLAGNLASTQKGIFVVAHCDGEPVIVVRYGDTPPDLT